MGGSFPGILFNDSTKHFQVFQLTLHLASGTPITFVGYGANGKKPGPEQNHPEELKETIMH